MPDGNRRFAKREGFSFEKAYETGAKTLRLFSDFFLIKKNWDELTFHFMSKYTHLRNDGSLKPIYSALINEFNLLLKENYFNKNKLKFIFIDHSNKLPKELLKVCKKLEENSKGEKVVRVLLGYDLETDERKAFEQSKNYEEFKRKRLISDIDLVVRTTEMRPSKGPVYAMAQAQMILLNKFNPEVKEEDLENLFEEYNLNLEYRIKTNPVHQS